MDHAAGLCEMHYQRRRRGQSLTVGTDIQLARELAKTMPCVAHGCERMVENVTKGVCNAHYCRLRAHGSYAKPRRRDRLPRITVTEKTCRQCGETKPAAKFRKVGQKARDGLSGSCHACFAIYNREQGYALYRKYGVSKEQYFAMVAAQAGLCAICGTDGSHNRSHGKLYVDHCHETGKVRGLLCHGCNVALGFMVDDPGRLERAAAYLRERG